MLIDGVDVRDWDMAALRRQISIIEQDIFLFSRSVADNIAFGCQDATQRRSKRPRTKPRPTTSSPASATATKPRWASGA